MSKKSVALLFLLMLSPVLIYVFWPTEEAKIRKLIREAAGAVEAEDVEGVMSKISYNYQDERGLSYLVIKKSLEQRFQFYSDIEVEYDNVKIEVNEDKTEATAALDLRVIATFGQSDRGYVFGDIQNPARPKLLLKKGGALNRWLVMETSGIIEGAG